MSLNLQTTTALIDENGILRGLEPFHALRGCRVRVVIVTEEAQYEDCELTPAQWERGAARLMAAELADDPVEDIYSREDGKPFDASQY